MNLGIKKPLELKSDVCDALTITETAAEAVETLASAGYEINDIIQWTANAQFAADKIMKAEDPSSMMQLLDIKESCEALVGKIEGEFTAEAALESVGEAISKAWETFKAWVKRVVTAIANLIKSIFGSDDKSDDKKMADVVASAASELPNEAYAAKFEKPVEMMDGAVVKQTMEVYSKMMEEMRASRSADDAARKEFLSAIEKLKNGDTAAISSANDKFAAIIEKQEKALNDATSKIAELESKAQVKAPSLQEANWSSNLMASAEDYYKKQIANIDADIRHEQDALREIEKAIDVVDQLYKDHKLYTGQYKDQKGNLEEQRKMREAAIKTLQQASRKAVKNIAELQKNAKWYRKVGLFILRTLHMEEVGRFLKDKTLALLKAFKPTGWIGRSAAWVGKWALPSTWRKKARIDAAFKDTRVLQKILELVLITILRKEPVESEDVVKEIIGSAKSPMTKPDAEAWARAFKKMLMPIIKVDYKSEMKPITFADKKDKEIDAFCKYCKVTRSDLQTIFDKVNKSR